MSGRKFDDFYFKVEEALIAHARGLTGMMSQVQANPDKYDRRTVDVLRKFLKLTVEAQAQMRDANEVVNMVEMVSANGHDKDTLRDTIDAYLRRHQA